MGFSQMTADGPLNFAEDKFANHSKQKLNWIGFLADVEQNFVIKV